MFSILLTSQFGQKVAIIQSDPKKYIFHIGFGMKKYRFDRIKSRNDSNCKDLECVSFESYRCSTGWNGRIFACFKESCIHRLQIAREHDKACEQEAIVIKKAITKPFLNENEMNNFNEFNQYLQPNKGSSDIEEWKSFKNGLQTEMDNYNRSEEKTTTKNGQKIGIFESQHGVFHIVFEDYRYRYDRSLLKKEDCQEIGCISHESYRCVNYDCKGRIHVCLVENHIYRVEKSEDHEDCDVNSGKIKRLRKVILNNLRNRAIASCSELKEFKDEFNKANTEFEREHKGSLAKWNSFVKSVSRGKRKNLSNIQSQNSEKTDSENGLEDTETRNGRKSELYKIIPFLEANETVAHSSSTEGSSFHNDLPSTSGYSNKQQKRKPRKANKTQSVLKHLNDNGDTTDSSAESVHSNKLMDQKSISEESDAGDSSGKKCAPPKKLIRTEVDSSNQEIISQNNDDQFDEPNRESSRSIEEGNINIDDRRNSSSIEHNQQSNGKKINLIKKNLSDDALKKICNNQDFSEAGQSPQSSIEHAQQLNDGNVVDTRQTNNTDSNESQLFEPSINPNGLNLTINKIFAFFNHILPNESDETKLANAFRNIQPK